MHHNVVLYLKEKSVSYTCDICSTSWSSLRMMFDDHQVKHVSPLIEIIDKRSKM